MGKLRLLVLAIVLGTVLIPAAFYLKMFTKIDASTRPSVSFNPYTCYECQDCFCTFTLDDNKEYTLNSFDKKLCELDTNYIKEGIQKLVNEHKAYLSLSEYKNFSDCVVWHSKHPSTY